MRLASDLLCMELDLSAPDDVDGDELGGPPTAPTRPLPLALLPALLLPLAPLPLLPVDSVKFALDGFNEPAVLLVQRHSLAEITNTSTLALSPLIINNS